MLDNITPIVLTYNEQANLARTLHALRWSKRVLMIDSFSEDNTLNIAQQYSNVQVIQQRFESFSQQCNFALNQAIETEWVLSMDADYVVTPALQQELVTLRPAEHVMGFEIGFDYLINGRPLRASLYPARVSLYRHQRARYHQDGHAHKVVIDGLVMPLTQRFNHDDRKPFSRWLASQGRYAQQEAQKLKNKMWSELSWPDRSRKLSIAPILILPYVLLFKGLIFDGRAGLTYGGQRLIAECYLQIARLSAVIGMTFR